MFNRTQPSTLLQDVGGDILYFQAISKYLMNPDDTFKSRELHAGMNGVMDKSRNTTALSPYVTPLGSIIMPCNSEGEMM